MQLSINDPSPTVAIQVHPIVFNWWVAVGVILSSAPFAFHEKFVSPRPRPDNAAEI